MENEVQDKAKKRLSTSFSWLMVIPVLSLIFWIVGTFFANLFFKFFPMGNGDTLSVSIKDILIPVLLDVIGIILILITEGYIDNNTKKAFIFGLCANLYHFIVFCMIPIYSNVIDMIAGNGLPEIYEMVVSAITCIIVICSFIAVMKYGKQEGIYRLKDN